MQASGGYTDDLITYINAGAINNPVALHDSHGEAGQVVLSGGVEGGHLGGFASYQGAARLFASGHQAFHHAKRYRLLQLPGSEIVKKEERLCPLHYQVVDAHGHQVNTNSIMLVSQESHFQLGP